MKFRILLLCALVLAALVPASIVAADAPTEGDEVGLFDSQNGRWYLRYSDGRIDSFYFGNPGDLPVFGDWNCDGVDTVGVYRPQSGKVLLRNSNNFGFADEEYFFGRSGDLPIAGDWDNDCFDTVGVFRRGHVFLTNSLVTAPADVDFWFGMHGDRPFAGNFNGAGGDGIGLHRAGEATFLTYGIPAGPGASVDEELPLVGGADKVMFAGDWNGNGLENIGQFRAGDFLLSDTNDQLEATYFFEFGDADWLPVAGELGPTELPSIGLEVVATGFSNPLFLTAPAGDDRLFVIEQRGLIKVIEGGVVASEPFLDLTGLVTQTGFERGLLGLAFHPSYATNGKFYVHYTDVSGHSRVMEYHRPADVGLPGPTTVRELVFINQNNSTHNGGMIQFGIDGRLYIAFGDGGGGANQSNGQNAGTRLASIVAINVDTKVYEIWAIGLRNPWRFDIDNDRIFIADVGEGSREEVSVGSMSVSGQNFGWAIQEGSACFPSGTLECDSTGLIQPTTEYSHDVGCSITGGFVYRGSAIAGLQGAFLYSDFCAGFLRGFLDIGGEIIDDAEWSLDLGNVLSFGEDGFGELYILTSDGQIRRIIPAG